jgi:hypothetical protein
MNRNEWLMAACTLALAVGVGQAQEKQTKTTPKETPRILYIPSVPPTPELTLKLAGLEAVGCKVCTQPVQAAEAKGNCCSGCKGCAAVKKGGCCEECAKSKSNGFAVDCAAPAAPAVKKTKKVKKAAVNDCFYITPPPPAPPVGYVPCPPMPVVNSSVFERYYAGGFGSLRGFTFRGACPDAAHLNNIEYQCPTTAGDLIYLQTFVDSGTVQPPVPIKDYRVSAGQGVRVVVPMLGPTPFAEPMMVFRAVSKPKAGEGGCDTEVRQTKHETHGSITFGLGFTRTGVLVSGVEIKPQGELEIDCGNACVAKCERMTLNMPGAKGWTVTALGSQVVISGRSIHATCDTLTRTTCEGGTCFIMQGHVHLHHGKSGMKADVESEQVRLEVRDGMVEVHTVTTP